MPFIFLPRLKMITNGEKIKAGLIGGDSELDQFRHLELFVRQLETNLWLEPRGGDRFCLIHGRLYLRVVYRGLTRKACMEC
jgi:hypothetical protein